MSAFSFLSSTHNIFIFIGIAFVYLVGLIGAAVCNLIWMDWIEFFKHLEGNLHRNYALLFVGGLFALCAAAGYVVALILNKLQKDCIANVVGLSAFIIFLISFCCQCFMLSRTSSNDTKCNAKYIEDYSTCSFEVYTQASYSYRDEYNKFIAKRDDENKLCGYIFNRTISFVIIEAVGLFGLIVLFVSNYFADKSMDSLMSSKELIEHK